MSNPTERIALGLESAAHLQSLRANPICVAAFTRQLALLYRVGTPLVRCLEILSYQPDDPALAEAVSSAQALVERGNPLSHALSRFPRIFGRCYHRLVAVAEATGRMEQCLVQLADWSEREQIELRKLKSALVYPVFLLTASIAFTVSLFLWVFPGMVPILEGFGVPLPWNTRLLIFLTRLVAQPTFWLAISLVLLPIAIKLYNLREGSELHCKLWLWASRLPLLGRVLRTTALIRYVQSLSILLDSGVSVTESCTLAAEASGSPQMNTDARRLHQCISEGSTFAQAIAKEPNIYGPWLVQIAQVGEESASLPSRLQQMVRMLEEDSSLEIALLIQVVEPMALVVLSLVVGFSIVSIFLPLYSYLGKL
jgi:type IV pilus assembly protein PilC